jgi:hypothetical protein
MWEEDERCVKRRGLGRRRVVDDRVGGGEGCLSVGEKGFVRSNL